MLSWVETRDLSPYHSPHEHIAMPTESTNHGAIDLSISDFLFSLSDVNWNRRPYVTLLIKQQPHTNVPSLRQSLAECVVVGPGRSTYRPTGHYSHRPHCHGFRSLGHVPQIRNVDGLGQLDHRQSHHLIKHLYDLLFIFRGNYVHTFKSYDMNN